MNIENIIEEAYDLGMVQNRYEIEEAAKFVQNLNIKSFLEIGTDRGGTFMVWSRLCDLEGTKISVDWVDGPWSSTSSKTHGEFDVEKRNAAMHSTGDNVFIFNGDSHSEEMHTKVKNTLSDQKVDFMFIDGDHSYLGVKLDFYMYKQFVKPGGWIAFHDIKNTEMHHMHECWVDRFWEEMDAEKVWFCSDNEWGGIGFVRV